MIFLAKDDRVLPKLKTAAGVRLRCEEAWLDISKLAHAIRHLGSELLLGYLLLSPGISFPFRAI